MSEGLVRGDSDKPRGSESDGGDPNRRENADGKEPASVNEGVDKPEDRNTGAEEADNEEPMVLPIDGVLDLHTFSPRDLPDLLDDYLAACREKDILDVRIIHGKGKGILRDRVRAILAKHRLVESWHEAPLDAGGWGATLVRLKRGAGN